MRKAEFAVPSEVMAEFAEALTERDLDNTITGVSDDEEILVEVSYDKAEAKIVDELEQTLDKLREQMDDEEDD